MFHLLFCKSSHLRFFTNTKMAARGNKQKKNSKRTGTDHGTICAICLEIIEDRSPECEGEDSIYCEGSCQNWLHRTSAGLPDPAFEAIVKAKAPFHCFQCSLSSHASEIMDLRSQLASIAKKLADLESQSNVSPPVANGNPSYSDAVQSSLQQTNNNPIATRVTTNPGPPPKSADQDRKFNLVLYGLNEHPKGTPRNDRINGDHDAVLQPLKKLVPTLDEHHIRDCFRLGKFEDNRSRPRPVLAKLNCASDVVNILARYRSTTSDNRKIFIKPDLSPEQRSIESLLLKERRVLIESSIHRKAIKIRGNGIFVRDRSHAKVVNGVLEFNPTLGDVAPALNHIVSSTNESSDSSLSGPFYSHFRQLPLYIYFWHLFCCSNLQPPLTFPKC